MAKKQWAISLRLAGSSPIRLGATMLAVAILPVGGLAGAVRPDYAAARAFGAGLQSDYQTQKGHALVARLDGEAMKRRVFATFGDDVMEQPGVKKLWDDQFYPSFQKQLLDLGVFPTLFLARVSLVDGARAIECVVLDDVGRFQVLVLRLCVNADGLVRIEDVRLLGASSGLTGAVRGTLLVMGARAAVKLDDEESALEGLGSVYQLTTTETFGKMAQGKLDEAFVIWNGVLPKFKDTAYWRSVRTRLALGGSARAMADLQAAMRRGETIDPFVRFSMATAAKNNQEAILAMDDVLRETKNLAFLRSVKAGLLLDLGRLNEAMDLARETTRQDPAGWLGYLVWIRAAIALDDSRSAAEGLNCLSRLIPSSEFEKVFSATPELQKIRSSSVYATWKTTTGASPTATHQP